MRIALLSAANSSHTVKIVNSLVEMGHDVALYSRCDHKDIDGAIDKRVKIEYLNNLSYFKNHKQLRKCLAEFNADVLYAHYASGYGTTSRLTKFHPTVLAVWGSDVYDFPKQNPGFWWLLVRSLKAADKLFSTSNAMAKVASQYTKKDFYITPFGVNVEDFSPSTTKKDDDKITIGFLKKVSKLYGIPCLVKAFALLCEKNPDLNVELKVYGDGELLDDMKQLSNELGIAEKAHFLGRIPHADAPRVLREMDIFCAPSERESFGVSVVEAMACEIPCITSDADGLTEVMAEGETGLVFPANDEYALMNALEKLCKDKQLRHEMGKKGRERVLKYYNWEDNIKNIEKGLIEATNI